MCGRYFIDPDTDVEPLREIIAGMNRREGVRTGGEIFPSQTVPVVASGRSLAAGVFPMRWGYRLKGGSLIINARSETAAQKPLFRDGWETRRCAIPASWYIEWEHHDTGRARYRIRPEGSSILYMAGLYRLEGQTPVFTILTREPADSIAFIHDRMPVILPDDLVRDWVQPRFRAGDLLRHAVTDVAWQRETPAAEQLRMDALLPDAGPAAP